MPTIPKREASRWRPRKERIPNENSMYYRTRFWKDVRKFFWSLPGSQVCAICKRPKKWEKYWTVDHINPIPVPCDMNEFVRLSEVNMLQSLCPKCNPVKTANDKRQ